jgi:UDP-glucose 4-epimerase
LERFSRKHNCTGVDIRKPPFKDAREIEDLIVLGDLRDLDTVKRVCKNVDAVIHLSAQVSVENSWNDPIFDAENNILVTLNLLKVCSDYGVERFVYTSSAAVYGNPVYLPIDENHPKNPISPYGVSKLTGEYYCKVFSERRIQPRGSYNQKVCVAF